MTILFDIHAWATIIFFIVSMICGLLSVGDDWSILSYIATHTMTATIFLMIFLIVHMSKF